MDNLELKEFLKETKTSKSSESLKTSSRQTTIFGLPHLVTKNGLLDQMLELVSVFAIDRKRKVVKFSKDYVNKTLTGFVGIRPTVGQTLASSIHMVLTATSRQ